MKKALIFWGGWDGHQPELVSARCAKLLEKNGFAVKVSDNQEPLMDLDYLMSLDLIVALWTMGEISRDASRNVAQAVANGVGLAGSHGGMCDAFRQDVEWQFMTGGQWVSHPGGDGVDYTVNITATDSPITAGLSDFPVCSEHYYLHIDPAIEVLATTRFPLVTYYHASNKPVDMPVAWTKSWGLGRVFYTSLGHQDNVFDNSPNAQIIMERGMLWAAEGKTLATEGDISRFTNDAKMY